MRRYQKKQLLEKFQIIHEAHECIERLMLDEQDITGLLADCQELAVEIGTDIENVEGEGTRTVELLEDYCEQLYHISERRFPVSPSYMAASTKEELEKQINLAIESLQKDIKEKSIIAFFPYKASMWDSMETIWKKYQQDSNVQTMVVALPYAIKDDNGKKVRKCYEGKDFPAEVPIINYEDFLENKFYVDIAIYHNPYDDSNKITEVDSRFFTSKLHDYAHTLVYIPYYVLVDKPAVTFVLVPGVKNADYVILQDEEIAEEFQRWYPKEKDKFLPLGSPKIDKAIEMNAIPKEDLNIPQEWKDRIRGKKVLFYNTHLINFYDENRDFIGKLKEVFATIQAQDNVVLWWRPHPLSDDMEFSTQQVERFQEYEALVEWYKQEDIGIYDDTPNLHEAIAASDAYYGDGSSVVKLFQAVGKPVMLQNCYKCGGIFGFGSKERWKDDFVCNNGEFSILDSGVEVAGTMHLEVVSDICIVDNYLWGISIYNGLFNINLKNGEMNLVEVVKDEEVNSFMLFSKIIYCERNLVLVPFNASNIVSYNLDKKEIKKCKLNIQEKNEKFYCAEQYEGKIYLIPAQANRIMCYSVEKNSFEELEGGKSFFQTIAQGNWLSKSIASCRIKEKLYFVICNTNILCEYDIQTCGIRKIFLAKEEIKFLSLVCFKDGIFIVSLNKPCALYWKPDQDSVEEIWFDNAFYEGNDAQGLLNVWNDKVYFTPCYLSHAIVFDITAKKVWCEKVFDGFNIQFNGFTKVINNKMYRYPFSFDMNMYESSQKTFPINELEIENKVYEQMSGQKEVSENGRINLKLFLENIGK